MVDEDASEEEFIRRMTCKCTYLPGKNVLPKNTRLNLNKAKELGITPTECAYQTCHEVIYGDR